LLREVLKRPADGAATKTLARSWRGPKAEYFANISWQPANRARHEASYPDRPKVTAAERADWSRVFKRVDTEHPKPGKNSFQALVGRRVVGPDLIPRRVVYLWHIRKAVAPSKSSVSGSLTRLSVQSSSPKPLVQRSQRKMASASQGDIKRSQDSDAIEALAWIAKGMSDGEIGYGPDAPKMTQDQIGQFKPAAYSKTGDAARPIRPIKKASEQGSSRRGSPENVESHLCLRHTKSFGSLRAGERGVT
jgi:hypothetical protein